MHVTDHTPDSRGATAPGTGPGYFEGVRGFLTPGAVTWRQALSGLSFIAVVATIALWALATGTVRRRRGRR